MKRGSWLLVGAVVGCALSGCGDSATAPGMAKVTGVVTFQGKAVAGANVVFSPSSATNPGIASQAVTDGEGRFQLSTHAGGGKFKPGIAPGQYTVTIIKLDTASIKNTMNAPKNLLPRKYGDAKTSNLSADVSANHENKFEFPLTAD